MSGRHPRPINNSILKVVFSTYPRQEPNHSLLWMSLWQGKIWTPGAEALAGKCPETVLCSEHRPISNDAKTIRRIRRGTGEGRRLQKQLGASFKWPLLAMETPPLSGVVNHSGKANRMEPIGQWAENHWMRLSEVSGRKLEQKRMWVCSRCLPETFWESHPVVLPSITC